MNVTNEKDLQNSMRINVYSETYSAVQVRAWIVAAALFSYRLMRNVEKKTNPRHAL
jgi:hypothetical protein